MFWLLISEIFPLAIRTSGMLAATIANWLANLVVAMTFLGLVNVLRHTGVFFIYAVLTFATLLFARILVTETKGLSLEAVETLWLVRAGKHASSAASGKPRLKPAA